MNKLPPEEIDGKMYQPVRDRELTIDSQPCDHCCFDTDGICELNKDVDISFQHFKCTSPARSDGEDVYYTNIEGE